MTFGAALSPVHAERTPRRCRRFSRNWTRPK